ncbi:hypothetical protein PAMP_007630 [Pampus punctatissimus]
MFIQAPPTKTSRLHMNLSPEMLDIRTAPAALMKTTYSNMACITSMYVKVCSHTCKPAFQAHQETGYVNSRKQAHSCGHEVNSLILPACMMEVSMASNISIAMLFCV